MRHELTLDARGPGRLFEGIGALTVAGQQRLLYDYPEPQRSQLLDVLFAPGPGAGAAFQTLKVEIGGNVCGSEGAEPSHAHTREELAGGRRRYRGSIWWLMREARRRNPEIVFEALPWGVPGWIGDDTPDAPPHDRFFGDDTIAYLVGFLDHAREAGLPISYLGYWNECPYRADDRSWDHTAWLPRLKERVHAAGHDVQLVAADLHWQPIVSDLREDEALRAAVDVVGVHYDRTIDPADLDFLTAAGKRIWQSEESTSFDLAYSRPARSTRLIGEWYGATLLARTLNANYADVRATKTNVLFFLCGYYDILYAPGAGLISADSPWSGHYDVQPALWAVAHTTQFARPGWRYLDAACGHFDADRPRQDEAGGTHVALVSPDGEWTIVAETRGALEPCELTVRVTDGAGLAAGPVHVWRSDRRDQLVRAQTLAPEREAGGDRVRLVLEPDCIYTLTTTTGQARLELPASPPDAAFPLPYRDDFDADAALGRTLPRYLSTLNGSFELRAGAGRGGSAAVEQAVTVPPIEWIPLGTPHAVAGDAAWTDYRVTAALCLPGEDPEASAGVLGRVRGGVEHWAEWPWAYAEGPELDFSRRGCYELEAWRGGRWELRRRATGFRDGSRTVTLAAGEIPPLGGAWHVVGLELRGAEIAATLDGAVLARVADRHEEAHVNGLFGLLSGWNVARYDEVVVEPVKSSTVRLDDDAFAYEGSWRRAPAAPRGHGPSHTESETAGDVARLRFAGSRAVLFGTTAPDGGYADVALDGGEATRVELFHEARPVGCQVVYVTPPLTPGEHTLEVRVTGERNPGALGAFVRLDRVDVLDPA